MSDRDPLSDFVTNALIERPTVTTIELVEEARLSSPLSDVSDLSERIDRLVARARGLGALAPFFDDSDITEVMVNGPGPVWIDRAGVVEKSEVSVGANDIALLVERILEPLGLRVDRVSPFVDARLPDGSRVNIVVPPLAIDGPVVTIRRFATKSVGLDRFGPPEVRELLRRLVVGRATMLVVGGTGAGKTTLLNALAVNIGSTERVITVEETAELRLPGDHVVRLESRPANREGVGEVTIRQLTRNALRMRPDRLVIGEVRGGEALDLLLALNTGHEGSLATCHANDPLAGLRRVETLALFGGVDLPLSAIREQLLAAVDVVVFVGKRANERLVLSVAEVDREQMQVLELWPHTESEPRRPTVREALRSC